MTVMYNGAGPADGADLPVVVFVGSSFQFSDRLLKLLKHDFGDIHFERVTDANIVLAHETAPRVVIIHEDVENLENIIEVFQRRLPDTQTAVACSGASVIDRLNAVPRHAPVSALRMDAQVDIWFSILRLLLSGYHYVPVESASRGSGRAVQPQADPVAETPEPDSRGGERLTPRELEILPMIAEGAQNKTIADTLGLSIHTVKLHSHNIFIKLGVPNRTGAANWYLSNLADRVLAHADPRQR